MILVCIAGVLGCGDGVPSEPASDVSVVPTAPPVTTPVPSFVVDTGPIPQGRLAFEVEVLGSTSRLYTMRTDGTGVLALTPAGEIGRAPAWSPDGSRLAYESFHDGAPEIWTVRPEGTGRTLVARNAANPFWLDDTRLGYQCGASLCAVRSDGTQQRILLARDALPNAADFAYQLSPDGRTIVFTRLTYTGPEAPSSYVYVMNADGTGERRLTPGDQGDSPQWSPVGRSIAYASARFGDVVVDVDAGVATSVSHWDGASPFRSVSGPGWSPTGTELVFGNDVQAFYFARADGTGPVRRVRSTMALASTSGVVVNAWTWTAR